MLRSDQDFQDNLSLANHVLHQFSDDFPNVNEMYRKSDNAGCYNCKACPESLYKICRKSGIILNQMDFIEPRKGKNQCDHDSAVARSVLRSFVDEGNNILTAEDIFNALITSGINDTKVTAVSFKKGNFKLTCIPIDGISIYHSFEFTEAGMKIWRYFNVSAGVFRKYSKDCSFHSAAVTIKEFTTFKATTKVQKKKNKVLIINFARLCFVVKQVALKLSKISRSVITICYKDYKTFQRQLHHLIR